jgi:hypothetical protein
LTYSTRSSGPAIRALKGATGVPVLFAVSGDPVELGIAESLARPGGNFTGSTFMSRDIAEKRVELLKDTFPQVRTFAVLSNTDHPGERSEWRTTQQAAQALGIEPVYVPFTVLANWAMRWWRPVRRGQMRCWYSQRGRPWYNSADLFPATGPRSRSANGLLNVHAAISQRAQFTRGARRLAVAPALEDASF